MSRKKTSLVQRLWRQGRCLPINGIHDTSGTLVRLDFKRTSDQEVSSFVVGREHASEVFARDREDVVELMWGDSLAAPAERLVIAGETSYGSEGFVALCHETERRLLWLAFFDFSNPFEAKTVQIVDEDHFAVKTNYEAEWLFSFSDPTRIVVKRGPFGWPLWNFWPEEAPTASRGR